uniref:Uncharacterized protein n=1 Tax=Anguilla anguilla TaxID=7936 RepID=A0A0E9SPM7_ANGAN
MHLTALYLYHYYFILIQTASKANI